MNQERIANHCIVVKPEAGALALIRNGDGYHLPVIHLPEPFWLPKNVQQINEALMEKFGLNCTTLRWLNNGENHNLVAMEWHPGAQNPERDVEWFDQEDQALPLASDELEMVQAWRQSMTGALAPWEQPG